MGEKWKALKVGLEVKGFSGEERELKPFKNLNTCTSRDISMFFIYFFIFGT